MNRLCVEGCFYLNFKLCITHEIFKFEFESENACMSLIFMAVYRMLEQGATFCLFFQVKSSELDQFLLERLQNSDLKFSF